MKTLIATKEIDLKNSYIFKNRNILIIFFIMIMAVFFGLIISKFEDNCDINYRMNDLLREHMLTVKNNSKPEIFSGLLLSAFVCYFIIALLSTSIIGAPLIYTVIFFKIAGLSTVLLTLYSSFGLSGIEYSVLVILPGKYFLILSLMLLADSSSKLSGVLTDSVSDKSENVKKYIMILIITSIILLASVVIDFFTSTAFSGLFDFTF